MFGLAGQLADANNKGGERHGSPLILGKIQEVLYYDKLSKKNDLFNKIDDLRTQNGP